MSGAGPESVAEPTSGVVPTGGAGPEGDGKAAAIAHPDVPRRGRLHRVLLDVLAWLLLPLLSWLPEGVIRLVMFGRAEVVDGNTLDATMHLMLTAQRLTNIGALVGTDDIPEAREQLRRLSRIIAPDIAVAVRELTLPGPTGSLAARHYAPPGSEAHLPGERPATARPLLLFFHGGGFVLGDLDTHDSLCRLLCRDADVHVLSVDYRLAPEHPAPAAVEDCVAAYQWATTHAAELGADPAVLAVGGDSAGGNLSAVVCQLARDEGLALPALQLLLYPVVDFAGDTVSKVLFADGYYLTRRDIEWFRGNYVAEGAGADAGSALAPDDPRLSPLRAASLAGLPPALVVTAGFDPLRDEGDAYAAALAAAGVPVDHRRYGSLTHGFASFFPFGGGSTRGTADVASALRAHLSRAR